MADFPEIPGGTGGLLGFLGAAVMGALLFLRKYLPSSAVGIEASGAQVDIIANLREQLEKESAARDRAEAARDAAIEQIGKMRLQIQDLALQVQALQAEVNQLKPRPN